MPELVNHIGTSLLLVASAFSLLCLLGILSKFLTQRFIPSSQSWIIVQLYCCVVRLFFVFCLFHHRGLIFLQQTHDKSITQAINQEMKRTGSTDSLVFCVDHDLFCAFAYLYDEPRAAMMTAIMTMAMSPCRRRCPPCCSL
jgi:hypothetical protein